MTAQLMTPYPTNETTDDQFAEAVGDAALAALLRTKPVDDEVPGAVWWLIAETLRTSVTIRRAIATDTLPGGEDLSVLIAEATLLTEAALAELAETSGARPALIAVPPGNATVSKTRPAFGLQLSVLFLARLLVSHKVTSPQRLANTLAAHLRALATVG